MIYNVAVIGSGQLGSRHIQGLLNTKFDISLNIVEPNIHSKELTESRISELSDCDNISRVSFVDDISELPNELDFVVIATNADIRFNLAKMLLTQKKVNNLILEKVLFQKPEYYSEFQKLLDKTETNCWVNHPRRCFPFYKKLKEQLENAKNLDFSISGGGWGLACNSLHFLDLISFLSKGTNLELQTQFLEPKLLSTKRENFNEFTGRLVGKINNSTFTLNHFEKKSPIQISITSDLVNICIDESDGWCRIKNKDSICINEKIIYFQSELTNLLLEDIIDKNVCDLPTFHEAMNLHLVFINQLIKFMNNNKIKKTDFCPIT